MIIYMNDTVELLGALGENVSELIKKGKVIQRGDILYLKITENDRKSSNDKNKKNKG